MPVTIREVFDVGTPVVAMVAGLFAAYKAIHEIRQSARQRREEFRWKRAELAKEILDEAWADPWARAAMHMLDWSGSKYDRGTERTCEITHEFMERALRTHYTGFDENEQFVRDSFDHLFDHLERAQHFLNIGLILFEDVENRYVYYVRLLNKRRAVFDDFLTVYDFALAKAFLGRFKDWTARTSNLDVRLPPNQCISNGPGTSGGPAPGGVMEMGGRASETPPTDLSDRIQ